MEDYKQKYEQALESAKRCYKDLSNLDGVVATMSKDFFEEVFPELKESDDERIKKNLREFLLDAPSQNIVSHHLDLNETLTWLEKQGEVKEYAFKSLPRLLDMIESTSKAKTYCQKLIDSLVKEGYITDAKMVEKCLKRMNGEDVPMAIMDEKKGDNDED